jgi:GGDEF domain-containing protein
MGRSLNSWGNATPAKRPSYFADLFDDEATPAPAPASPRPAAAHYRPDRSAFLAVGERMLRSARQHQQAVSLVVLQVADLPELEILFGREAANEAVHAVMKELSAVAGQRGFAIRTSPDTFALVMPRCTGKVLELAIRGQLGEACCVELDFNDEEIVLVPDVQARTVEDGDSIEKTYSVLCRAMTTQRHLEQLRRDHLRREREAHTPHGSLAPDLAGRPALPPSRAWRATLPATIAMRLG